jgi:hypothetical protein
MIGEGEPFPAAYKARQFQELPAAADAAELRPDGRSSPGGLIFEVDPEGIDSWIGVARPSSVRAPDAVTGLFSAPAPGTLCAIAQGAAYLVNVRTRNYCVVSRSAPVMAVASLPGVNLLLLATPWLVTAIGHDGVAWRTRRLAIDGLRLDETDGSRLAGVADPDSAEPREFTIDLLTGSHQGGAMVTS